MRGATTTYLPAFVSEQANSTEYLRRLGNSVLYPAFSGAIESLAGKVFSKPIRFGKDVPPQIVEWTEDIDRLGNNLHEFAKERFMAAWRDGFSVVCVEMPPEVKNPDGTKALITKADAAKRRPWLVAYDAGQWYDPVYDDNGRLIVARLYHEVQVREGLYANRTSKRIRVYFASDEAHAEASYEVWEEREVDGLKAWAILEPRQVLSGLTEIPAWVLIAVRTNAGQRDAEPPLMGLAHWNVRDWQKQSDLDNIEHVANVPVFFSDCEKEQVTVGAWGPSVMMHGPQGSNPQWLELQGTGIKELKESIASGRDVMRLLALEPMIPRTQMASESTVADAQRGARANSALQSSALGLQNAIEGWFQLMAKWALDLGEDKGGSVTVNQKYLLTVEEQAGMESLLAMRAAGDLSRASFWREAQRRDLLSDDFDAETEEAAIAAEGPAVPEEEDDDDKEVSANKGREAA